MADTKISALATLTDPVVGDFIPIVDTSDVETKKIDISGIDAYYNANHYGIVDDNSTDNLANLNTLSTTINAVGGGVLYLPFTDTGIYRVDATAGVLLRENVTLMMDPGVKIVNVSNASGSTNSTVRVSPGASIINAEFEHLSTSTTWSGAEIMLQTSQVGKWLRTDRTVLDNIKIQGVPNGLYDGFGSGIYLRSDVLNTAIQWCKFSNIWFNQVASCFEMRVSAGTSGNPSFINGNIFENIYTSNVSYVFLMAGQATYSNINENIVQNVFHQSSSPGSFKVIYCEGRLNTFRNIVTFDWEAVVGTTSMFQFTATALSLIHI